MTWEGDRSETQHSTLDALEAFIASQRALISRQRADIDRLQHLKNDLSLRPGHLFDHLSEELDDPAFKLSSCADLKLRLPSSINWKAFDRSDPTPLHALSLSIPTRTPLATQTAPLSELQSFVKNAARTLLEPRMRKYPRVPTPPPDSDSDLDARDPAAARREREQAKIRELKDMVRRGGSSGLRTMGMGVIRTDVGEESMRAEVRIDDDDATHGSGGGFLTGKRPGKGKRVPGHSRVGKHTGKHYGKTISFQPSQSDDDTSGDMVAAPSPAPSHATKNIGLVAEHARSAAASPEPFFDVQEPLDMDTSGDHRPVDDDDLQLSARQSQSPSRALDAPPVSKAKPRQRTRAKPKSKPKANSKRAKPSYEYTDDESELDLDLTHDAPEEDEPEYQDPRDFVPSVTIHPSDSSEDEEAVAMEVDIPVRKSNTAKKPKKSKARTKKAKDKASASAADLAFASDDYDYSDAAHPTASSTASKASRPRKPPKPKPETYKQAWSTDEQNLLEQLLEEIPDGERFRWQKISRAMGGRRTPRQVASRVQKYFEKLKKYDLM